MSSLFDADFAPHTAQAFHQALAKWRFRDPKPEGQRTRYRGPSGGTLRVNNSRNGMADPQQVAKAAEILGITVAKFWGEPSRSERPRPVTRKKIDSYTATVLSIHTAEDRPMSFDQVVKIAHDMGYDVTRDRVSQASSTLCKGDDLRRIRSGVYQWAGGKLINRGRGDHIVDINVNSDVASRTPTAVADQIVVRAPVPNVSVDDVFDLLFPNGVKIKLDDTADLEEWRRLTGKFISLTV